MKNFKVQVDDSRSEFFKELLKCFDFIKFEEVEGFTEPRVYPGGNFEIRSQSPSKKVSNIKPETTASQNEDVMRNIREAMKVIDQQRDRSRQ